MQQFTFPMRRGYLKDFAVFALLRRFFVSSLQFFDFESYLRIAVSAENCAVFRIEFFHRFFSFVELSVESIMCDVEVFETQVPLPPPCAHNLPPFLPDWQTHSCVVLAFMALFRSYLWSIDEMIHITADLVINDVLTTSRSYDIEKRLFSVFGIFS